MISPKTLPGYFRAVRLLTNYLQIMTKEMFEKKLAFTIENVEKNKGYVSGLIIFSDGGHVKFEEDSMKMIDNEGDIVFFTECDAGNVFEMLYGINPDIVERVYPDCC